MAEESRALDRRFSEVTVGTGRASLVFDYGRTYLVTEDRLGRTIHIAQEFLDTGRKVLCVSRLHPDLLADQWGGKPVNSIWLSERPGPENVPPEQLQRLQQKIALFAKENKNSVVVMDGIEYLSLFNDFQRLQIFVEQLNDVMMDADSILLIALDPRLFDLRSTARLRRFAEVVA